MFGYVCDVFLGFVVFGDIFIGDYLVVLFYLFVIEFDDVVVIEMMM